MAIPYEYSDEETGGSVSFSPASGILEGVDSETGWVVVHIPKREAINFASKLLQWGTSA